MIWYPLPKKKNAIASDLALGTGAAIWFIGVGGDGYTGGYIGRIALTGATTLYPLPTAPMSGVEPLDPTTLASGPDGALWFVADNGSVLEYVTTTSDIAVFLLPPGFGAATIISGPDGALWFTDAADDWINRLRPPS